MADDSFEFNISRFIDEQKRLLALERERFAIEKNNILEPENVGSPSVATVLSPVVVRDVKQTKKEHNDRLVAARGAIANGVVSNGLGKENNRPSGEEPCPVEKLMHVDGDKNELGLRRNNHRNSNEKRASLLNSSKNDGNAAGLVDQSPDNASKQQDAMEQWVSDTFFSYFPSFNKNTNEKKSMLSKARQADYQEYLKNIPQVTTKHQQYMEKYGNQAVQTEFDKDLSPKIISPKTQKAGPSMGTSINNNSNSNKTNGHSTGHEKSLGFLSPTSGGIKTITNTATNPILKSSIAGNDPSSYVRKGSPREKLIQDLNHTDLSTILNTDTIDRRNRLLAEVGPTNSNSISTQKYIPTNERGTLLLNEESRRKLEYQRELIKQIEEKRKEVERLREKEKLEEEMLTSRLEQQLKTMQLEEELEREKQRSEKIRLTNEQNHIRRLQLLSKLENDHKLYNPYDDHRKTLSENGKEVYIDPAQTLSEDKEKVYRYFSNSAQNVASGFLSSSISSEMEYDESSNESRASYERYQYCKNCRADIDRSFMPRDSRNGGHYHHKATPKTQRKVDDHCLNCQKRLEKLCIKCERVMKRSNKQRSSNLCNFCQQSADNSRLQREAQSELKRQRHKQLLRSLERDHEETHRGSVSPPNPYKIIDIQYHESDNDQDLSVLNPVIVRKNYRKPYSMNIDKESLFHPSKKTPDPKVSVNIRNGEVFVDNKIKHIPVPVDDTMDDITTDEMDDRISKYVKHYNTLWMKRGNGSRKNNLQKQVSISSKLPPLSPPKVYISDRPDNLKSEAMKNTEKKWDIPAVERTRLSPGSPRVLTQLGAIRKQLQLEQLQMDQTYTKTHHPNQGRHHNSGGNSPANHPAIRINHHDNSSSNNDNGDDDNN
ncbi:probable serine/threonine-protein kinase cdc7 isoform X2 [Uranotaenia lowii]|uniref:probable serine/threonine-protein kinase cdc7 isoform X2 n=1 Tax=Uranotaenia lowii TaxID=190385 RepID=UPI0024793E33|nr:probable serine/threonine-protein kinase cdc7 isoform X2 [Uranotaenia lowii]